MGRAGGADEAGLRRCAGAKGKVRVGTGTPAAAHIVLLLGTVGVGGEQRLHHRLRRVIHSSEVEWQVPFL